MADEKSNQDPAQAPEKIENPTEEISAEDLDQVSGGMQASGDTQFLGPNMKVAGDLTQNTKNSIGTNTKTVPPIDFDSQPKL